MTGGGPPAAAPSPAPHAPHAPLPVVDIDLAEPGAFRRPGGGARPGPSGRALGLVRLHGRPLGMAEACGGGPEELWQALADTARRDFPAAEGEHGAAGRAGPAGSPRPARGPGSGASLRPARSAVPAVGSGAGEVRRPGRGPGSGRRPARGPRSGGGPRAARGTGFGGRRRTGRGARPGEDPGAAHRGGTAGPPSISVIVATRNRAGMLRDCLDSLLALDYPRYEVIVVDNAPADTSTEHLVRREYAGRRDGPTVRYLREPVPGLARAHNRGLAVADGDIAAFTDDDTLVDPHWLTALAEPFLADPRTGCVTGLIVPAELDTEAQIALERHGAFGKGYAPLTWSLREPPADPLFPFTAGRFGSGANMAFRTELLHGLGGFDPATGTGTPARGGDDLLAFFRVLAHGRSLAYEPTAIVWHRHRRTHEALAAQAYGYGAGFGAFLAAALAHEPRMLPALLRRLSGGVRYAIARNRERAGPAAGPDGTPSSLARLELRGLLYGPIGYLRSRLIERRTRR
ncbi:glycosyltransferase [Streptomyces sp. NPDC047972]|uniref:glycosyltransferase n=1 Tax=Streptomyces sp. NPDC047972 TaxID=3365493 RepID=UPI0037244B54